MDSISEAKLQLVHPKLAEKVCTLAQMMLAVRELEGVAIPEGIEVRVTQGLRSWNEQDGLYAQGRTKPGPIVTNCPGGHSYHNFGLAVDLVPDDPMKDGFQCDWNLDHPVWKKMIAFAESLGLHCGADWKTFKDWPHVQLNGRFPEGSPNDEVRQLFKDGGQQAVWDEAQIV